jgi:hypothetical protein
MDNLRIELPFRIVDKVQDTPFACSSQILDRSGLVMVGRGVRARPLRLEVARHASAEMTRRYQRRRDRSRVKLIEASGL